MNEPTVAGVDLFYNLFVIKYFVCTNHISIFTNINLVYTYIFYNIIRVGFLYIFIKKY